VLAGLLCFVVMVLVAATASTAIAQDASPADDQPAMLSRDTKIAVGYGHAIEVDETTRVNALAPPGFQRDLAFPGRKLKPVDVYFVGASESHQILNAEVVPWVDGVRIQVPPGRRSGPREFEIEFRILHGVAVDEGRLVWPLTMAGDRLPLQHARLEVSLPEETPSSQIHAYFQLDGVQVDEGEIHVSGTRMTLDWTAGIAPGQALDAVVTFPRVSEAWSFDAPKAPGWMFNGPLWLAVLAMYCLIAKRLISGGAGKPVIVEYEAPPGWSAGAIRLLWHGFWDRGCFAAGVLGIAAKGGLTLAQADDGSWLATRTGDDGMPGLTADERLLRRALFTFGHTVSFSEGNADSTGLAEMAYRRAVEARCADERPLDPALLLMPGWFIALGAATLLFFGIDSRWTMIAEIIVISLMGALALAIAAGTVRLALLRATRAQAFFVAAICAAGLMGGGDRADWLAGAALLAGQVVAGWWLLRQPQADTPVLHKLRGFRWYLDTAEQQDMDARYKPSLHPELQASLLPYAMALDVEVTWNTHFAQSLEEAGRQTEFTASLNSDNEQAALNLLAFAQSLAQRVPP
jgi:hypothetical protein